jgi:hypothetical protein
LPKKPAKKATRSRRLKSTSPPVGFAPHWYGAHKGKKALKRAAKAGCEPVTSRAVPFNHGFLPCGRQSAILPFQTFIPL